MTTGGSQETAIRHPFAASKERRPRRAGSKRLTAPDAATTTMRTLAIVNQKGGSGKTTTVVNLAAALAEQHRRVLVLDLDPQASASGWLGVEDGTSKLLEVMMDKEKLSALVRRTNVEGVDAVGSSMWLAGAETALGSRKDAAHVLRSAMGSLPAKTWDYVLLDCPPTLGFLTVNAITAASEICVPVETHVLPLKGLVQLLRTVDSLNGIRRNPLERSGILACRVDRRTRHSLEVLEQLRDRFDKQVYRTVIRESVRLAECPSFVQPITRYAARSTGAFDYRALASEVVRQERSG